MSTTPRSTSSAGPGAVPAPTPGPLADVGTTCDESSALAHVTEPVDLSATASLLLRLRTVERELQGEMRRRRQTQAAARDLARATTSDDIGRALFSHAGAALGASAAVLYRLGDPRFDEEPSTLYAVGARQQPLLADAGASHRAIPLLRDTAVTIAVRHGEAVWHWPEDDAAPVLPLLPAPFGGAVMWGAVPVLAGARAIGCLALAWSTVPSERFGDADHGFVHALADQCAVAMERMQLTDAERRQRRRTERLQRLTAALSEARTVEEVTTAAVAHASSAFGAVGTVIALRTPDDMMELARACDMSDDVMEAWRRTPLSTAAPLTDVIRTGEAIFLRAPADWVARYPALAPIADAEGHRANAVLPLDVDRRTIGAMGIAFDRPRTFRDDEDLMLVAARQCALALERARLYEAERTARAEAEAANRAKSDFLAVMSHELRTPLNAIGGYVELLDLGIHGPVTDEQRQDYQRIQAAQRHLIGLINDVLNYVRIETGRVQYAITEVPLHETLFALHALFAPQLRAKGLAYTYAGVDPAVRVRADRDKLNQILLNLLMNAIKFTDRGGRITLEAIVGAERVMVHVHDTGIGIPPEQLDAIFEPFVQVDKRLTRTNEGVGLGLSISRDLARGMGGDLVAESAPGVGSVLTLVLPAVRG